MAGRWLGALVERSTQSPGSCAPLPASALARHSGAEPSARHTATLVHQGACSWAHAASTPRHAPCIPARGVAWLSGAHRGAPSASPLRTPAAQSPPHRATDIARHPALQSPSLFAAARPHSSGPLGPGPARPSRTRVSTRVTAEEIHQQLGEIAQQGQTAQRRRDAMLYALSAAALMFGVSFLAVPIYQMFCQATGYGGTTQDDGRTIEDKMRNRLLNPNEEIEAAAAQRQVRVSFDSYVSPGMPWTFEPCQRELWVRPGQSALAFFNATNRSGRDVVGVSTYNVVPNKAGVYFNKIQCFCFEEQRLKAGESIDMPVFFYLDPELATDARMNDVKDIILSYTFFEVEEEGQGLELANQLRNEEEARFRAALDAAGAGAQGRTVGDVNKTAGDDCEDCADAVVRGAVGK